MTTRHDMDRDSLLALGSLDHTDEQERAELEAAISRWIAQNDTAKWPRGLQWFENASYLLGNHLTKFYYDSRGFGFHRFGVHDQNDADALVAKVADNKLIRPTESVASMLTQAEFEGRVEPASEAPEDEDAATLSEIVLRLVWEKPLDMPGLTREMAIQGCISGTCAIEVTYGATDVPLQVPKFREVEEESELLPGGVAVPLLEPTGEFEVTWKRDIRAKLWSAFHLIPDPQATTPSELKWIGRQSFEDIDEIRESFTDAAEEAGEDEEYFLDALEGLQTDSAGKHILYWYSKLQDIIETPQYFQHGGGMTPTAYSSGGYAPNQTVLTVIDVKPTKKFPKGRTLIFASGRLLYAGPARAWSEKYPWRWHPYAFWGWFKVPGRWWHVALLSQLVPLQKKINAIDALVQANRQYMSLGQWLIPKHSNVPLGLMSGHPGREIRYTDLPGHAKPERVDYKPLPAELIQERSQLEDSIGYIAASGFSAAGGGPSASALRSESMLQFLRNEAIKNKSPMLQEFQACLETVCQNILIDIQLNLDREDPELTQRVSVAAADHGMIALETFTGQSLRDHHSVKIDVVTKNLRSPEAIEQRAQEFFAASGGQVSPAEREGVMKAMGLDRFVKNPENASVRRARRMISRIVAGRPDLVFPMDGVDNAGAMVTVFQNEILSDRFLGYEEEAQSAIVGLFDYYRQVVAAEQAQAMQQQIAMAKALGQTPDQQ